MNPNSATSFDWRIFPIGAVLCLVRVIHDIAEVNKPNSTQQQIRETAYSLKSFTTHRFHTLTAPSEGICQIGRPRCSGSRVYQS